MKRHPLGSPGLEVPELGFGASPLGAVYGAFAEPDGIHAVHTAPDLGVAQLRPGDKALVVGGVPIGVPIAVVVRRAGADLVLAEPDPYRRSVAERLGDGDPRSHRRRRRGDGHRLDRRGRRGRGLRRFRRGRRRGHGDRCAGHPRTAGAGRHHPTPREVNLHRVFWREPTLLGARLYERQDFGTAVALLADGHVPVQSLISRIEPLERGTHAFETLESGGGVMKVLIDCRPQTGADRR